jgi:L-fuconolactonase
MTIDAHQHYWQYNPARDTWITDEMRVLKRDFLPEELNREHDANGIDASILVQVHQSENENVFLLDLAEPNHRIAGVVGWVDFCAPDVDERLQALSQHKKLCGLRHIAQAEPDESFLVRPDFVRGIGHLSEFGFVYEILIYPKQFQAAIELVSRFPEQPFVLDHLAKPEIRSGGFQPWATHVKTLAQHKNVLCKLSGLVTEADWTKWKYEDFTRYLDVAFHSFGPDRLMFGSDWPVCLVAASYGQVKEIIERYVRSHFPQHYPDIFGGNAIRFYGLKATSHGFAA